MRGVQLDFVCLVCTCDPPPCGPSVREDELTKSRKLPTPTFVLLLSLAKARAYVPACPEEVEGAPFLRRHLVRALVQQPTVPPVARPVVAPMAVLDEDGLARLVQQVGKHGEVQELAAPVQLDAVEPKVDGGADLVDVVVEAVRERAFAKGEPARRLRRA